MGVHMADDGQAKQGSSKLTIIILLVLLGLGGIGFAIWQQTESGAEIQVADTQEAAETAAPAAPAAPVATVLADAAPELEVSPSTELNAPVDAAPAVAPLSDAAPEAPAIPIESFAAVPEAGAQPVIPQSNLGSVSGAASEGVPPLFDLVRIDQHGGIVVAGRATPGSTVTLRLGEEELASIPVGPNGQFVAIVDSQSSETPQALQLESTMPDQVVLAAAEEFIVLPAAPDALDAAPALVRKTPESFELVQPFVGNVDNVSLDAISYSVIGSVELTGRAKPGTTIRAYADSDLIGETLVGDTGAWRLDVPGLNAGRYTLRIDEVDVDGKVTSRVESPFQRATPEVAAAHALAVQAGGQVIVQPGNTLWLMATQAYGEGMLYTQIFAANSESIRDPDLIYPGQVFSIPTLPQN